MIEQNISETFRIIIGFLILMLFLVVGFLGMRLQDVNTYTQQVNYQIEREGGLTPVALDNLKKYSKENYNGVFEVTDTSDKPNEKHSYGSVVNYKITGHYVIHIYGDDSPVINWEWTGNAVSQVR